MKSNRHFLLPLCIAMAGLLTLSSCDREDALTSPSQHALAWRSHQGNGAPKRIVFYALTNGNELVRYRSGNPLQEQGSMPITGLQPGEWVAAIDFRPATGQLYGVTNQSRLYILNTNSGAATAISMMPFSPAVNGTLLGFDFNPTVDRIRLVTDNEQNLRLHPETGMVVAIDGNLNPGDRTVNAVAYTNSFAGATQTTLYDIDLADGKLYKQIPPNDGTLQEVGNLNLQAEGEGGFDISPDNSVALAVLYGRAGNGGGQSGNANMTRFYYIDLETAQTMNAGMTSRNIIGLAIPTDPVAYAVDFDNRLLIFNPEKSQSVITRPITGLAEGEDIVGLDMRPVNGQLFALGSTSRLYVINTANGMAAAVSPEPFSQRLNGTWFGFDFNPTVDRIRIVSNTGQNLRAHPGTGDVVVVDGALNPGIPSVDAAAYSMNFAGTTTTSLFVMDYTVDKLFLQSPPNDGTLVEIGDLGWDIIQSNGFDIGGTSGEAMGIFTTPDAAYLCRVNTSTGQVIPVAPFTDDVRGFALGLGF